MFSVLVSLLVSLLTVEGVRWCGYQDEWRKGYSTITYRQSQGLTGDDRSFNFTSGIFTSPQHGRYQVVVSAVVGGMLPPKPGDLLMNTSPVYAQIFLKFNGNIKIDEEPRFLTVQEGQVSTLTRK